MWFTVVLKMAICVFHIDDTAILAESEGDLKNALIKYENYCNAWKLTVNVDKSKIIVFSKGRQTNYDFNLCGSRLEIVNEYKYLGILFIKIKFTLPLKQQKHHLAF